MESKQEVPTEEDLAGMELATNMLNVSLYLLNENATLAAFGSADRYHHSDTSTSISSVTKRGRFVVKDTPTIHKYVKPDQTPDTRKSTTAAAAIFSTPMSSGRPMQHLEEPVPVQPEEVPMPKSPSLERQASCDVLLRPPPPVLECESYKRRHNSDLVSMKSPPSMQGIGGQQRKSSKETNQIVNQSSQIAMLAASRLPSQVFQTRKQLSVTQQPCGASLAHQQTPMFLESRAHEQIHAEPPPILNMMQTASSPRRAWSPKARRPRKLKKSKKKISKRGGVGQRYLGHLGDMLREWKDVLQWQSSQLLHSHVDVVDTMSANIMGVPRRDRISSSWRQQQAAMPPHTQDGHQSHNLLDFSASFIAPQHSMQEEMKERD